MSKISCIQPSYLDVAREHLLAVGLLFFFALLIGKIHLLLSIGVGELFYDFPNDYNEYDL